MMHKSIFLKFTGCLFLALLLLPLFAGASLASPQSYNAPRIKVTNSYSTNWSGYAAATSLTNPTANSVTDVKGSWTVPGVTGSTTTAYSSAWVGIDGYSDGSVEQVGTEADWSSGAPRYYAWYEMYPKYPVVISSMTISPGDSIAAEVSYAGSNRFVLTITDQTTNATYTTTQKARAQRSSAEWIVEAPSSRKGVLPLADFGSIAFTNAAATINGHSGPVNDPAWQFDPMTMVSSGGTIKAQPSALSTDGSSFSDQWLSS